MRTNGKITYVTAGMVTVVLALGAVCLGLLAKQRRLQEENFLRAEAEQQCLGVIGQARNIHMNLYRGLSWSSSGYETKEVEQLLKGQSGELTQLSASLEALAKAQGLEAAQTNLCRQAAEALKAYTTWALKVVDVGAGDATTGTMVMGSAERAYKTLNEHLTRLVGESQEKGRARVRDARSFGSMMARLWTGLFAGVALLMAGMARYLLRSIALPIQRSIGVLSSGAEGVKSASLQVKQASQTLAEGSSEQAASLEETSASLQEMSSTTSRNAQNARAAKEYADQTSAAADAGVRDMTAMKAAMSAIQESSADIAKIIKTIDELAFQTNLLALNAAVEAARAGEAGMGFAVVAEEVRGLARRSADAAKDIASRIEGAVGKTSQGVQISAKVAASLEEMVAKARKVNELIHEIARSSQEQSAGIDQMNHAVSQVDHVTQQNASTAEESAAASAELSTQAESLDRTVADLLRLVGGQGSAPGAGSFAPPSVRRLASSSNRSRSGSAGQG
jgi:methyl-accepting chemotaxis protein